MPTMSLPGIFCLEGAWQRRLDDRTSVLPTLEMLERLREATYIHRDVGTREELKHYLSKWSQAGYRKYGVLYFAFHGTRHGIEIGSDSVTLEDLADILNGKATGRIIYFGCCSVMRDVERVDEFRRLTKAKVVCGFAKPVGWVESAAFDLLALSSLSADVRIDARFNRLKAAVPDLHQRLKFRSVPGFDHAGSST